MTKNETITERLQRAIDEAGSSRYLIAKATGISESLLSRFMAGTRGLPLRHIDALAELLNLELVQRTAPPILSKMKAGRKPKGA